MPEYVVLASRFSHRTDWSDEGTYTLHVQGQVIELDDADPHTRRLVEERIVEPKRRHEQIAAVAATEGKLASEVEPAPSSRAAETAAAVKAKG